MQRTFSTPEPVSMYVELRSGDLAITTAETDETVVEVVRPHGDDDDDVTVEQRGDDIVVVSRHGGRGGLFGSSRDGAHVRVTMPHDSRLVTKLGSAEVRVDGRLGESSLKSGSGEVRLDELSAKAFVETGSGDLQIGSAAELQVRSGSGQVTVERLGGAAQISTGSGDVLVGTALEALSVKSGSGDLRVREVTGDVTLTTASGDLVVDRMLRGALNAKNASGDVVVGVPAGIPVWTDVSTVSGSVRSSLQGAGAPAEGQEFVELRAKTVSGDISLEQL